MNALLRLIRNEAGGAVFEIALIGLMFGLVAVAALRSVGMSLTAA